MSSCKIEMPSRNILIFALIPLHTAVFANELINWLTNEILYRGNDIANSWKRYSISWPRDIKSFPRHSCCISFFFFNTILFIAHLSFFQSNFFLKLHCSFFLFRSHDLVSRSHEITWERDKKDKCIKNSSACHLCF